MAETPVVPMPAPSTDQPQIELIDCIELAKRVMLTESWVRSHVRRGCVDMIPHLRFGDYIRFEWNSEALNDWIDRHRCGYGAAAPQALPEGPTGTETRELASPVLRMDNKQGRGARLARAVYCNRVA